MRRINLANIAIVPTFAITPTIAIMALALILGAWLRGAGLDSVEMSADEGASWAAAAAPSLAQVIRLQARFNPGKFGVHDVLLHEWMRAFGTSLAAMRMLSAAAGTIAILLVFVVTRELLQLARARAADIRNAARAGTLNPGDHQDDRESVAAIAALVFAVNLVTIKYSRELRMHAVALALTLAQVWFFIRATRRGGALNYIGAAIFTALCAAATLTSALILMPEGLWLIARLWPGEAPDSRRRALAAGTAISVGLLILAPVAIAYLRMRPATANLAVVNWIARPAPWAPLALFNKATGSFAFPALAPLCALGLVRGWRDTRAGVGFAALWMFAPPIALVIVSYVFRPAFVERYMLSCFVPFFILVAIGIGQIRRKEIRLAALALVVALAIGHVRSYDRKPHDTQWREAIQIARVSLGEKNGAIAIAPAYAVNVARYYLSELPGAAVAVRPFDDAGDAAVAVIGDNTGAEKAAVLARQYPILLAHPRGVVVRHR
jgi:hypothetical protein